MKTAMKYEQTTTEPAVAARRLSVSDRQGGLERVGAEILNLLRENPQRQGLLNTPERFAKALGFLTSGYETNTDDLVGDAVFDEPSGELVFVRDIEFFSLCEHHMLPFFGKAHVAYVPNGKVIGLSKIPRIVDAFARRLQVQERLTQLIAEDVQRILSPKGVCVMIEASHLCMMMRGVEKQNSMTVTKSALGVFASEPGLRAELLALMKR
jgi:GTP cyclohydrolase I